MNRAIEHAREPGKTLVTLDTRTGDGYEPLMPPSASRSQASSRTWHRIRTGRNAMRRHNVLLGLLRCPLLAHAGFERACQQYFQNSILIGNAGSARILGFDE
jgi:hypothetical protein